MQVVIDIPKAYYEECKMQGKMIEQEGIFYDSSDYALKRFIANGTPQPKFGKWMVIPIPEGTTNADMIKTIFPDVKVKEKNNGYEVYFGVGTAIQFFNHQWWNAPYKAKSEEVEK